MQQSKKVNVRYITFTAVMAALVFVFTFTFKIPLGTGYTHLGDMMIFLAVWLLGGKKAAPAAGLGACLADLALGYAAWYGLGRAFIEGLRMDSLYWGPFRVSQVLAGISCVAAVAVLLWQGFRPHDPAKMLVNQAKEAKSEEAPKTEDETHENEG